MFVPLTTKDVLSMLWFGIKESFKAPAEPALRTELSPVPLPLPLPHDPLEALGQLLAEAEQFPHIEFSASYYRRKIRAMKEQYDRLKTTRSLH